MAALQLWGPAMAKAPKPKIVRNGYDQQLLKGYLEEIDAADQTLERLRSEYMNKCKGPHEDIAGVFEAAKEADIPVRALKTIVKNRRLDRRMANNVAKLEADDADSYEALVAALGDFIDLPLGQAAVERKRGAEQLDSLA
jgi:uncharacterized protein (UPF0335 family)